MSGEGAFDETKINDSDANCSEEGPARGVVCEFFRSRVADGTCCALDAPR